MQDQPTIYIIGAGAIGNALTAFLTVTGKNVVLVRGSIHEGSVQLQKIEVALPDNTIVQAEVEVNTFSNLSQLHGIVVLTNKSYGNISLAKLLQPKIGNSPIVILQNGLNVEQPFIDDEFSSVYRSVLFATSQPTTAFSWRFKPVTESPIGIVKGDDETLNWIVKQLHTRFFPFRAERGIKQTTWLKSIVNAVFNSVCPLLETDNGIFYRNPQAAELAKRIIAEGVAVAQLKNIKLNPEEVLQTLLRISQSSNGQFISTYQDIKNKRKTEIDTLNIALVNIAEQFGKPDLVKETRILGELIKIKADLQME